MFWLFWGVLGVSALAGGGAAGHDAQGGRSDFALVTAAQKGDADAFGALHARYYRRIYHLAFLKTNNASDAEDIASETFIKALSGLSRFRFSAGQEQKGSPLYPWLHRIAVNLIIDSARQRPPSGIVSLDAPLVSGVRSLLGDMQGAQAARSPQEIVEQHEVQQLVRSAIGSLPDDQAEVLIYRYLGELSVNEMSPLLARSEAAVKSLLHRAVVALRHEIEQRLAAIERLEAGRRGSADSRMEMQSVGQASSER